MSDTMAALTEVAEAAAAVLADPGAAGPWSDLDAALTALSSMEKARRMSEMKLDDGTLSVTVFETTRRTYRRGWWSRWSIDLTLNCEPGALIEPLASGWVRRSQRARYRQFALPETQGSKEIGAKYKAMLE